MVELGEMSEGRREEGMREENEGRIQVVSSAVKEGD